MKERKSRLSLEGRICARNKPCKSFGHLLLLKVCKQKVMIVIMSSFLFFACANASELNKKGEESILGLQVPPCKPNPKREREMWWWSSNSFLATYSAFKGHIPLKFFHSWHNFHPFARALLHVKNPLKKVAKNCHGLWLFNFLCIF